MNSQPQADARREDVDLAEEMVAAHDAAFVDDLSTDEVCWIGKEEAFARIRGVASNDVLTRIEELLEQRRDEEVSRQEILGRKAAGLLGATALVFAAWGLVDGPVFSTVEDAAWLWGVASGLTVIVCLGLTTAVSGWRALRVSGYPTHSDNIILNRPLMGRFALLEGEHDAQTHLIPYRHVTICNLWLIVDETRRRNETRSRFVKSGQTTFLILLVVLGMMLVGLRVGIAMN